VVVAGITQWRLQKVAQAIPVPHFEVTADADGNYHTPILSGWVTTTGSMSGYLDTDATNITDGSTIGISAGLVVTLDLIVVKATPTGFSNLSVLITNFSVDVNTENQPARFTAEFSVNGNPGKLTTVS
jgi:hypothetical protein